MDGEQKEEELEAEKEERVEDECVCFLPLVSLLSVCLWLSALIGWRDASWLLRMLTAPVAETKWLMRL